MPAERVTLYYHEGSSDKIYQASLEESGGGFIVVTSLLMALFAANLYRRSWNRRARYLMYRQSENED